MTDILSAAHRDDRPGQSIFQILPDSLRHAFRFQGNKIHQIMDVEHVAGRKQSGNRCLAEFIHQGTLGMGIQQN